MKASAGREASAGSYDLAVAYRIYPQLSREAPVRGTDKLKLAAICLTSFRRALGPLNTRMFVLLDDCPPEYEALFRAEFKEDDLEFVRLPGAGNPATFARQCDILSEQVFAEKVCFAEDDYLYQPEAMESMWALLDRPDVDFVTPYDHPDYYGHTLHNYKSRIIAAHGRHWRTVSSTCLTFMTTRKVLRRSAAVFNSYARGCSDTALWLSLTGESVFKPAILLKGLLAGHRFNSDIVRDAWRHNCRRILFGRRSRLWAPMPSLATHLVRGKIAPGVDWQALVDDDWLDDGHGSES